MHDAIKQMLANYQCDSQQDYINALKEIFQEIALLGLWRAKFYEHAAFYGGSSLRILYGLDRFSEDLDFSLLKPTKNFNFNPYNKAIESELKSFGFDVKVEKKVKNIESNIDSAFIKGDTKKQLVTISAPTSVIKSFHHMHTIKIKMEVDVCPPQDFQTEAKILLRPMPFSVRTLTLPNLFAGKIHAILCRPWVKRVKGRDWYDFIWYIGRDIPVDLAHLKARLVQSGAWQKNSVLEKSDVAKLLASKIEAVDFENAKMDVLPFLKDAQAVDMWSKSFFHHLLSKLRYDF